MIHSQRGDGPLQDLPNTNLLVKGVKLHHELHKGLQQDLFVFRVQLLVQKLRLVILIRELLIGHFTHSLEHIQSDPVHGTPTRVQISVQFSSF